MAKLTDWEDSCDAHMLRAAGVYAIVDEDGEVLYIGETVCFIVRWGQHCNRADTHRAVPYSEIYEFRVLEYEDNREKRLEFEKKCRDVYQPKYGGRGRVAGLLENKDKRDTFRIRQFNEYLRLNRLAPMQASEGYFVEHDTLLETELKHLNSDATWNKTEWD